MDFINRSFNYLEDRLESNYYLISTSFFVFFNLLFDLSFSKILTFLLPDSIRKYIKDERSDEDLRLFPSFDTKNLMDVQIKGKHNFRFLNSTKTLLTSAILNGNVIGEWIGNLISILQMITTGLLSSIFMYFNPNLLQVTNPFNYRLNNTLLLLHSLKTGEFLLAC